MRTPDSPEGWQKRLERPAPRPRRRVPLLARLIQLVVMLGCLAGGIAGYVYLGRESHLAATLPMPKALKTVSASHEELLVYGRALVELTTDVGARIKVASPANAASAQRLRQRLDRLHRTGAEMEPLLTREEGRALIAFQRGERMLRDHLDHATRVGAPFDPEDLADARRQLEHGLELARGKRIADLVPSGVRQRRAPGSTQEVLEDVRSAGQNLRLGVGE
jgi:hypothetical protein